MSASGNDPVFFSAPEGLTISALAELTGARLHHPGQGGDALIRSVAPLERAAIGQLSFLENPSYAAAAASTGASACFTSQRFADRFPASVAVLVAQEPYKAYAVAAGRLFPASLQPQSVFGSTGVSHGAIVHPSARLEAGVIVDPGAVIGPGAEIGAGSMIGATAVIGPGVRIGRQCAIGPGARITHALIGNRVIIHQGASLGQDGFGFAIGPKGHLKVPQVGRVVVQDDVEIGANSTIDRGATRDTIIGEGTKVDNLVQIGHNVVIGRHCVIVSQVGISGSAILEDFVVLGGQVGVVGHLTIGAGSQIAGSSNVATDVPRGSRWGGTPAKPIRDWFREIHMVKTMAKRSKDTGDAG
jgi:UDP-3-O-[3-hydroxymyristoyl] glucosamine N-acyltransferase